MLQESLIFGLITGLSTVFAATCQPGWKHHSATNSCYKPLQGDLPWTIAEFRCLFQGSHLASITSDEENRFVHGLVGNREMFTGGAYFGSNPVYVNSDGKPFALYENWQEGVRPAMNRARRCIKVDSYGEWFQSCCKQYGRAVCKKPAPRLFSSTTTTTTPRPTTTYGLDPAWTKVYKHKYYWRPPSDFKW
ncbi:unnamed protein product, partial [Mesorhabditis belari]|uniref:C-type lectin domain-containing protein n=1 Tax=Mesorhabditis belari TaxID=2138241 RepID=A0AAF3F8R7_9BILA